MDLSSRQDLEAAAERLAGRVHRTPVLRCSALDERVGRQLWFKCENLQKVGAFKARGATNAVLSLSEEEAARGVITHSSGNHAQALAWAARERGIPAHVVMPENAPAVKVEAVRGYGAEIRFCPPTQQDRESTMEAWRAETGATFVPPYDDMRIVCGQATAAMELLEEVPDLDLILAPVGGGGLLSGTALACRHFSKGTRAIGAEPFGADDAWRSLQSGERQPMEGPRTIADGLLTSLGERTFSVIRELVPEIVRVEEAEILEAMQLVVERAKLWIEPSAAVPVAALISGRMEAVGDRVGVILSGGNASFSSVVAK